MDKTGMSNPQLKIRDAVIEDTDELATLITELGYPATAIDMRARFIAIKDHPDYKTIVVEAGEELIAMAGVVKGLYYEKNGGYVKIVAFVVKQTSRNQGIGKILIKAAEDWAVSQNCYTMLLTSRKTDERKDAYAFYQKSGYEIKSSGFVKQL